jgi:hypothetical protein
MTSTVHVDPELRDLTPVEVLAAVADARRAADREEARLLALAVHWVDLHPVNHLTLAEHSSTVRGADPSDIPVTVPSRSRWSHPDPATDAGTRALGGVGTPGIAEHALDALGATLGLSHPATLRLVSESVELCFRLPRLWALVHDGRLQAWKARQVAHTTVTLSPAAVDFVDRHLAVIATRNRTLTPGKLHELVHEAMQQCDPDQAAGVEQAALDARGVWFDHRTSTATTDLTARLDTPDALDLQTTLTDLAGILARLGDTRPLDLRQATALGLLAHPQRALNLAHRTDDPAATVPDTATDTVPDTATDTASDTVPETFLNGSRATLFLHLTAADLAAGGASGCGGRVEKLGPATLQLLKDWLDRASGVTLRPVLDLARTDAVDAHDPPGWMRETVILRDAHCVFPGCPIDARACDLDHLTPYVPPDEGGPPGQTTPANLAPLCRRHHRLKTFTAWTYQRLPDGDYQWTDPHTRTYRVTPGH